MTALNHCHPVAGLQCEAAQAKFPRIINYRLLIFVNASICTAWLTFVYNFCQRYKDFNCFILSYIFFVVVLNRLVLWNLLFSVRPEVS